MRFWSRLELTVGDALGLSWQMTMLPMMLPTNREQRTVLQYH
jgi:hypothetical protein